MLANRMVDENYFGVVSGGAEPARVARTPTKKAPRAARTPLQARDPNAVQAFEPEKKPPPATPQPGRFAWLSPGVLLKTERRYGAPKTVECECCYERVPLAKAVTCTKGQHACCHGCVSALVQARISEGSAAPLRCISTALCDGAISQAGLAAALASPVLRQRDAIVARAELARAKLPNMVTCPFCPYAVVVDDVAAPPPRAAAGHERRRLWTDDGDDGRIRADSREGRVGVLRCRHPLCGKVSCVACKDEIEPGVVHRCVDRDGTAADAATDELVRSCPSCGTRFFKDHGCNKMRCPTCDAESCYVCRQLITEHVRYSHFCFCDCNVSRRGHITRAGRRQVETCASCGKCSLWHVDDPSKKQKTKLCAIQ